MLYVILWALVVITPTAYFLGKLDVVGKIGRYFEGTRRDAKPTKYEGE